MSQYSDAEFQAILAKLRRKAHLAAKTHAVANRRPQDLLAKPRPTRTMFDQAGLFVPAGITMGATKVTISAGTASAAPKHPSIVLARGAVIRG